MLTEADRRLGHGLAAAWLEAHDESDAQLLGEHYDRGGDAESASRCFTRAARQALDKNDFEAVLERARRSIALGAVGRTLAEAYLLRGRALVCLGRLIEAHKELEAVLASDALDDDLHIETLREQFFVLSFRQEPVLMRRAGEAAMKLARQLGHDDLAAEANAVLATADHADALADAGVARWRAASATIGERPSTVVSLSSILLYHAGLFEESQQHSKRMIAFAIELRDPVKMVILSGNRGLSLAALGRYAEAREQFEIGRAEALRRGLATFAARTISMSAGHHLDVLDVDGAERIAREAVEMGRALEFVTPRVSSTLDLAFVAVRRGDPGEAARIADTIAETVANGPGFHGWLWRERMGVLRAEIALARGEWEAAITRADASIVETRSHRRHKYQAAARVVRAHALANTGRRDQGAAELATFLEETRDTLDLAGRLRTSLAWLAIDPGDGPLGIALETAARVEAGLPTEDRAAFRAAVDPLLRPH
jgi:tetratricopeptide (TPR) repeat protein